MKQKITKNQGMAAWALVCVKGVAPSQSGKVMTVFPDDPEVMTSVRYQVATSKFPIYKLIKCRVFLEEKI